MQNLQRYMQLWGNYLECWRMLLSAKHVADNKEHSLLWSILLAPKDGRTHKNLEAFFIAKLKPLLNRQEDSNMPTLFRNNMTLLQLHVHWTEMYSKLAIKILRECLNDFLLVSLLQTLSKNLSIETAFYYYYINVLILICKCNHGDFNSDDVFSLNCIVHILALKMWIDSEKLLLLCSLLPFYYYIYHGKFMQNIENLILLKIQDMMDINTSLI